MSLAIYSLFRLFQFNHGVRLSAHPLSTRRPSSLRLQPKWRKTAAEMSTLTTPLAATPTAITAPLGVAKMPLRVSRVVESQNGPQSAGRMVISGSMKDVCAELDRLAKMENSHMSTH
jgi:hypothetical protein